MKDNILVFMKSPFVRNVAILASGTAMAQAINMLFSPLITRIYGPEAYGLMGTFSAIIQIIGPISALSYPIAIVLPKLDEEAEIIAKLSFFITLINTMVVSILLFLFDDLIVDFFNLESVSKYLIFLPFIILSAGILQIIQQWFVRKKLFQASAKANLLETIIVNSGQLIGGVITPLASVLIFFTSVKQGIRALLMYIFMQKDNLKRLFSITKDDIQEIFIYAKKFKDFPQYRMPEVSLSAITANVPTLLLTGFFGPVTAGFYAISRTVLGVPSVLIAKSVGDVFYPRVSESANNKQKITPLVIKATVYLVLLGIIPYGVIILFGPQLFSLVFGQDWMIAGEYARWLAVRSFFSFINIPSVQALPVISAQKFQLFFTIINLIMTSFALISGFYIFNSDIIAIALSSISGALLFVALITITIFKSKKFDGLNRDSIL